MKPFIALVRRELWESHAFWIVPGVFALVLVAGTLFGLVTAFQEGFEPADVMVGMEQLQDLTTDERRELLKVLLVALAAPFNVFLVGVIFFYALDSLYADRRDRSVLFFKSLPVSDVSTVLSKLAMALLVGPALTLAVIIAFEVLAVLFGAGMLLWMGVDGWYYALDPVAILAAWALFAWGLLAQSLVYLPLVAWLMLASAWAKKAPFLWAVVPPVVVIVIEQWFMDDSRLLHWLSQRMTEVLPLSFSIQGDGQGFGIRNDELVSDGAIDVSFALLGSGMFWQGVAVATVLLAGVVWLRRYRADAE